MEYIAFRLELEKRLSRPKPKGKMYCILFYYCVNKVQVALVFLVSRAIHNRT